MAGESQPRRPFGVPPDPEKEWSEYKKWMDEWLKREIRRGDKWFLITLSYWKKFEDYLGDKTKNPGPVDLSDLVDKDGDMLDNPAQDGNFKVIHEKVWNHLSQKFGVKNNHRPIQRQVVNHEILGSDIIERKLLHVFLAHTKDSSKKAWVPWIISRGDRLFEVEHHLRKCFNINRSHEIRMWHLWDEASMTWEPFLSKFDRPGDLYDLFEKNRRIVYRVEPMNDDRTWPLALPRDSSLPKERIGYSLKYMWGYQFGKKHDMGHVADTVHRGICGLQNVENCCYMNCVIQILAQIPSIREYCRTDTHIRELNKDNALGRKGEFGKEFGNMIKHMWSQKWTDISPETFKVCMARHNNLYQAYGLHDAHEFLMYFLDGFHEDCNRIKKKPFIEIDTEGKSDEAAAKECWDTYKQRNESIVIDLFHYLAKSTLECPYCDRVSVKFDAQFGLCVPVPHFLKYSLPLTFVYHDPSRKPIQLRVSVKKIDLWNDYQQQISEFTGVPMENIVCGKMVTHRSWSIFWNKNACMRDQAKGDWRQNAPLSLEKPDPPSSDHKIVMIEIFELPADCNKITLNCLDGPPFYFHMPFWLIIHKNIKYEEMYNMIYERIKNRLPEPKQNWWEWKSPEDDEEEKMVEESYNSQNLHYRKPDLSNDTNVWEKNGRHYLFRIVNKKRDIYYPNNDEAMNDLSYGSVSILFHPRYARDYIVPLFAPDKYKTVNDLYEVHESCSAPYAKDIVTLENCLEEFYKQETLDHGNDWYCSKCKRHQLPKKTMGIWSLPNYLFITLQRFDFKLETNDNKKIETMVKFPLTGLDMDPYVKNPAHKKGNAVYDLTAVVNHSGTLSKGHYTSFIKHCEDDYWYFYNDDKITPGHPEFMQSRQAYMFCFKRRNAKELEFIDNPDGVTEPFTTVRTEAERDKEIDERLAEMYGKRSRNKGIFLRANPAKGRLFDEYDPTRLYYDPEEDD